MVSEQTPLWVDDIYEALKHCCIAIAVNEEGNGRAWAKVVGHKIWPQKSPDEAGRLLIHCIDQSRNEKLDPDQVVLILRWAREVNCHVAMHFIANECMYHTPTPVTPEEQIDSLQRDYIDAVNKLERITMQMRKIQGTT